MLDDPRRQIADATAHAEPIGFRVHGARKTDRILELEAEVARLRQIDDERHSRAAADISRRVDVETELLRFAVGKRGPIEPGEARRLALKLGVPDWFNDMVAEKASRAAVPGTGGSA